MSPSSLVILVSLLWLTWRIVQLWSTPLTLVLRHLQIEVPSPPRLTIDALTADSVSLHWAPPDSHVKKHIIQMDGQDVGISVRGETSVTISGLAADFLYSVQVIAVNAQGFQVASSAVYVRTRPKDDKDEVEADEVHEPHLQHHSPQPDHITSIARQPRKRASLDIMKPKETTTNKDEPKKNESRDKIEDLSAKLDAIRKETNDLDGQLVQLQEQHTAEEAIMLKKIEELRTKKKEEDDVRLAKDQQHKQLDQQKREIETKRNQAQKALKAAQDTYEKQATDIQSFASSAQNSIETVEHLQESLKNLETETDEAVQEARRTGSIAAEELSEIESEIKYLLSRKAEAEGELAKLQSPSRVSSPSPQEKTDVAQADSLWKEREESLIQQFEEAQYRYSRIQSSLYAQQENHNHATSTSEPATERSHSMRRQLSRRDKSDEAIRPDPASRSGFPTFNPDATPFVASTPSYAVNENPIMKNKHTFGKSVFSSADHAMKNTPLSLPPLGHDIAGFVQRDYAPHNGTNATTSIFSDEPSHPRIASPFARRESPRSSQSGSNPPSPAIQNRIPSIFNAAPGVQQRNSSGSLVASLNGTPLNDQAEPTTAGDGSKWFWPVTKKKSNIPDPLALDRKNTRSLPKVDVAPIGTRRNRSGSLREENKPVTHTATSVSNGYHDLDLLNVIGHPLSRTTSTEIDNYSTSALPLPKPSNGRGAFGWEVPGSGPNQRQLPNPWNNTDPDKILNAPPRSFDPFGDLPAVNSAQLVSVKSDFLSPHTTIDASRLPSLRREASEGSRKSSKSLESKDRVKRLGETGKFSSFVGRVFGKKDDRDDRDSVDGQSALMTGASTGDT